MSFFDDFVNGLNILKSKAKPGVTLDIAAEHDIIYCAEVDDVELTKLEIDQLDKLGWHISEYDCWSFFC